MSDFDAEKRADAADSPEPEREPSSPEYALAHSPYPRAAAREIEDALRALGWLTILLVIPAALLGAL